MDKKLISVSEAARRLGRHKGSLHRRIDRLGIHREMMKSEDARGQRTAHISESDFALLQQHVNGAQKLVEAAAEQSEAGYFYIIQLEPESDPRRIKLGFATSVYNRARRHRTSAPFASVLRAWPCRLLWERTAIECLTHDSEQLYTEGFRAKNVDVVVARAEKFFDLMPSIASKNSDTT